MMTKFMQYRSRLASRIASAGFRPLLNWKPESSLARYHRRATFRSVYRRAQWGKDGRSRFFSGIGSRGEPAARYADTLSAVIELVMRGREIPITIVDLGCGDFSVAAELLARLPPVRYLGCDVVPELIRDNQTRYGSDRIAFKVIDIVSEDLPDGDICTVRQVLQHLPNLDIMHILKKLRKYEQIYVTEGQPLIGEGVINPDKAGSAEVRFDWRTGRGRGVELDQPPYSLSTEEVCRVRAPWPAKEVVVTYRVDFPNSRSPREAG
jgi:SAM-dependent methyltransferase